MGLIIIKMQSFCPPVCKPLSSLVQYPKRISQELSKGGIVSDHSRIKDIIH